MHHVKVGSDDLYLGLSDCFGHGKIYFDPLAGCQHEPLSFCGHSAISRIAPDCSGSTDLDDLNYSICRQFALRHI